MHSNVQKDHGDTMEEPVIYNPVNEESPFYTHVLNSLARRVHNANKNWWINIKTGEPLERNIGEMLMLCVTELAEALEGHRKNLKDDHLPTRNMFEVEIADCMIRLFDISGGLGIDLGGAFEEKMAYNQVRKDHSIDERLKDNGKKF